MKAKLFVYLKGLGLTYLAMVIFSALGWINIGATFEASRLVVPLLMATVVWTAIYFLSYAVWVILALFASCTMGIGFLIGLGILGYVALRLAAFLLPVGWITFTDDPLYLFMMGGGIALIDLIVDEEKRANMSVSIGGNYEDEDDEEDDK